MQPRMPPSTKLNISITVYWTSVYSYCMIRQGFSYATGKNWRYRDCTVELTYCWWPKPGREDTHIHRLPSSLPASERAIMLIISPLMAIEQDQALDLNRLFGGACLPLGRIIDRIDTIRRRFSLDRFAACFQAHPEHRALLLYRHQVYIPPIP
jgi:hypothetical protein